MEKSKKTFKEKIAFRLNLVASFFRLAVAMWNIAYILYLIATKRGALAANIILLIITAIYVLFLLVMAVNPNKDVLRVGKKTYRILKLAVNGLSLGITIYGLVVSTNEPTGVSIVMAAVSVALFLVKVIFEIFTTVVTHMFRAKVNEIKTGVSNLTHHNEQNPRQIK